MPSSGPTVAELLAGCKRSAVHLETRDHYGVAHEAADFQSWLRTGRLDTDPRSEERAPWVELVSSAVTRGVSVRRARVVSEPVSDCIRYEHASTVVNLLAGEEVRWLPRRQALGVLLPATDFWLFDETVVRWGFFSGEGALLGHEVSEDPGTAGQCAEVFKAVWQRAVPHAQYDIH